MQSVFDFYDQYDEDTRLSVRHKTEFFASTYFLDSIIKGRDYILDTAAGTGIYSIYYANRGCRVEALDIVPKHIDILNNRNTDDMELLAHIGDARDLSDYAANSFDVVLNMGAIYHIEENEIDNCISENLRVLKPGGYFALAYLNKQDGIETEYTKYGNLFKFHNPKEIESYLLDKHVKIIQHVPTDDELFKDFEDYMNNSLEEKETSENKEFSFEQSLSRIEDYHFWLEENFDPKDIDQIEEKFIHALIIVKKDI